MAVTLTEVRYQFFFLGLQKLHFAFSNIFKRENRNAHKQHTNFHENILPLYFPFPFKENSVVCFANWIWLTNRCRLIGMHGTNWNWTVSFQVFSTFFSDLAFLWKLWLAGNGLWSDCCGDMRQQRFFVFEFSEHSWLIVKGVSKPFV